MRISSLFMYIKNNLCSSLMKWSVSFRTIIAAFRKISQIDRQKAQQIMAALENNKNEIVEAMYRVFHTSVHWRYTLSCQDHIKWGIVKLSGSDKGLCFAIKVLDQLDWISCILHVSTLSFSLFPFSDTTRTALDMLIICGFIMQETSTFSKKRWYHNSQEGKVFQNIHSVHVPHKFYKMTLRTLLRKTFALNKKPLAWSWYFNLKHPKQQQSCSISCYEALWNFFYPWNTSRRIFIPNSPKWNSCMCCTPTIWLYHNNKNNSLRFMFRIYIWHRFSDSFVKIVIIAKNCHNNMVKTATRNEIRMLRKLNHLRSS